ncbi:Oidioi.mRNA.OKI2018_I69.XSR.g15326.t1.cds [Oikopleura dioica]|uniref:Carbohydrate sulfotransferase n=1 Tax=Oikopleura dioica TaxID=34765 RepID=A0ABN7SCI7_OIKDI|nr:Oidioi.mRNA.OKI2018_I69.XSR.g15326.t1.cds [Oikopleura dioica]
MRKSCSVLPELEALAQNETKTFEDLIFFHRRIHDTNFVSSVSKNVHHCSSNVNRKSHVFDITSPLNLMICLPPKCGTTNWQRAMSAVYLNHTQKNYNPKELLGHSMYKILPRVDLEKLRKATETRSSKFKENRFRIANVRNPFSRLYSAWGDKQRVTSSYLSYWRGVKPFQEALGNPPQGMNNSFTAFAQYVAANPGNSKMNFHWTSTFSQCHPCAIDYNIITHLENSGEESEVIMKMFGLGEDVKLGEKYAWSPAKADELKWQSVPRGTAKKSTATITWISSCSVTRQMKS